MPKHTETFGRKVPNGSIDFDKVQAAAKAGKDDIFAGAVTHQRDVPKSWPKAMRDAAEEQQAEDAAAAGAPLKAE